MGVNRYSRDFAVRRRQEFLDHLQQRCRADYDSPSIGELTGAGIKLAEWVCNNYNCYHHSKPFDLERLGAKLLVRTLRRNYVCSRCGANRPQIELLWED